MKPALEIQDLSVAYGADTVVRHVSLEIAPGESYGLVGESGCGKTTVGMAVARYLPRAGRITGGHLTVAGEDPYALDRAALRDLRARSVAMVYQEPAAVRSCPASANTSLIWRPTRSVGFRAVAGSW